MIQKKGVSNMAVCESCGARVQDGITICPECGRPVVKMKTSLGLKGENGKKPVQQRAYTPTDDYGDIYDGKIIKILDTVGAIVEIARGKEGMVHISKFGVAERIANVDG